MGHTSTIGVMERECCGSRRATFTKENSNEDFTMGSAFSNILTAAFTKVISKIRSVVERVSLRTQMEMCM